MTDWERGLNSSRQIFQNLYRVPRRALEKLVAADKEGEPARMGKIAPDAAHEHIELAAGLERHREMIFLAAIDDFYARRLG